MLTDKELEKLHILAVKAQPFYENEPVIERGEYEERKLNNCQFLIAAKNFVPMLIDEVLNYRKEQFVLEADKIPETNVYNEEVYITNNYTTNYVDLESIEKLIDKKLNENSKPMKGCCNE